MTIASGTQIVNDAEAATPALSPEDGAKLANKPDVLLVDVREQGELDKSGTVQGSVHVPRSHLEFKADPASPMHERGLDAGKCLVLFCASGKRAALAAKTLKDMGYSCVKHVTGGGFDALKKAGAPIIR